MDKDNSLVKVQGEDGKVFNMLILKEFDYKKKKYAVLTEIDHGCGCDDDCNCDETCDCGCQDGEECTCGCGCHDKECSCGDDCHCDENCDCGCQDGEECTCEDECHCKESCHCDEPMLCLLEITKDEDGNEVFKSIDDEKLFNELVEEADKVLYED